MATQTYESAPSFKKELRTALAIGAAAVALVGGVKLYDALSAPGYRVQNVEITGQGTNSIWAAVEHALEDSDYPAGYVANETDRIADARGSTQVHPGDTVRVRVPNS